MDKTVAEYKNVQEKVPQALKVWGISKICKICKKNPLWGIEPRSTDPELGVYTFTP